MLRVLCLQSIPNHVSPTPINTSHTESRNVGEKKERAQRLPQVHFVDRYAVWSSTFASGAFFATEAIPLSRALLDS